jgi:signal transduction histidine kinase
MPDSSNKLAMDDLKIKRSRLKSDILPDDKHANTNRILRIIVILSGVSTCLIGILVLCGWILGIEFLKSLNPSYVSMKANTSVCFILFGSSLLFHELLPVGKFVKIVSRLFILVIIAISLLSLSEYLFRWNSGIDELLFKETQLTTSHVFPGRLAFSTCFNFLLLAFALIFIDSKIKILIYISQVLPLAAGLLSLMPVLGYLYRVNELIALGFYSNIALHTAITFLLLSIGVMCLRPASGFLSILTVNGSGGYMARRLLPTIILIPVVFVWLRLFTNSNESRSGSIDVLIISILYIGIIAFSIWKIAKSINSIESDRLRVQHELIKSENQNLLANEILEYLNRFTDTKEMITSVIKSIKDNTGFEAVAIRIKEGEDFPYYETSGLSDEFVEAERHLCSYDAEGNIIRDSNDDPLLECMCGNILCNRVDSSKSFFTHGGSFRSNNTTALLATTTDEERLARTRNRCNSSGYESVALVPLRSGTEIVGLLQLNDHRTDVFDEKIIPFFERIGSSIGIAIMRNKAENEIKELNVELEKRVRERTEQLLDSNKELESFAYSVSHDLRAPLRHIVGFSEILESELGENRDQEITRLTGIIKSSAARMSLLIDELLTYSRLGRTNLKTVSLLLNPIIDDIINEASDITRDRNISWKVGKLPEVKADPTLIRLVLQNLIDNSIKFTGKKNKAEIEISFDEKNKKEYEFYVKDNGAGFNMEYANKLFGVFQRLHSNEEFEGTGIGLATVRRIIRRHSGKVWAKGSDNEGATFYFTLPR